MFKCNRSLSPWECDVPPTKIADNMAALSGKSRGQKGYCSNSKSYLLRFVKKQVLYSTHYDVCSISNQNDGGRDVQSLGPIPVSASRPLPPSTRRTRWRQGSSFKPWVRRNPARGQHDGLRFAVLAKGGGKFGRSAPNCHIGRAF